MFKAALFVIAENWKQLKCPSNDESIKRDISAKQEYYSAVERNELLVHATV